MVSASDLLAAPRNRARRTRGGRPRVPALAVAVLAIAACFAAPFAYLVVRTLGLGAQALGPLSEVSTLAPLARSVALGLAVAVAAAVLGVACGWLVARTDLPGARSWALLFALPLVIPSYIGAFTLQAAFATGGLVATVLEPVAAVSLPRVGGFPAAFAVLTLLTYPYVFLPVVARLRQAPASLEESARLLGRGPWATFASVVLPQIRSSVLAGALLVFLYTISDFGAVQLLRYDTLTRVIYASRFDRPAWLVLSLQLGLLAVAVAAGERAATTRDRAAGGRVAPGRGSLRVRLRALKAAALAFAGSVVVFALLAPLSVLVYWAARGIAAGGSGFGGVGELVEPLRNTALVGLAAAAAAALAVLPVAYHSVRHRGRLADAANALVVGGFALPGLTLALALVTLVRAAPALYQSLGVLVFAYVVHFGAQTLRTAQVGVAAMPPRVDDAARLLGASPLRRLTAVELPLLAPSVLAGAGLVLLSTMKELPATYLLAPTGFETLATRAWGAMEQAYWAQASVFALALVAVSAVLTWVFVLRRSDALA